MHKRIATFVACLGLLGSLLLTAAPVAATVNNCQDIIANTGLFVGFQYASTFHGARVWIDPGDTTNDFNYCDGEIINNNATLAWVAIEPAPGNAHYGDSNAIFQVGICRYNWTGGNVCDSTPAGKIRYFWGAGGCLGGIDMGIFGNPSDPVSHKYWLDRDSSGTWSANVDSLVGHYENLFGSQTACWINGPIKVTVQGERKDRGDSLGSNSSGHYLQMNEFGYKRSDDDTWRHWVLTQGQGCNVDSNYPESDCSTRNDANGGWNNLDLWTN
jgi:hypothetical protein